MADNKRWFKVWTAILSDPDFDDLPNDVIGVWVRLGALVAKHGEKGKITVTNTQFEKRINYPINDIEKLNLRLTQINVAIQTHDNGTTSVIFTNWLKYQVDSTGYERLKRFRENQNDNGVKSKKKIKNKKKNKDPLKDEYSKEFLSFWESYPKRKDKAKAYQSWLKIDVSNGMLKTILDAIEIQKKCDQWQNPQYIPMPTTWLNNSRWEDETDGVKKPEPFDMFEEMNKR